MVRDILARPVAGWPAGAPLPTHRWLDGRRLGRSSNGWMLLPALVIAVGLGASSALGPLQALVALGLLLLGACVWKWPALAAYLVIGLTPLTAGISRGVALPLVRPHEALALFVGGTLALRALFLLRTGVLPALRLDRVEVSMVLLAVFSSVVPLAWMALRQQAITTDDQLYALVLWKYFGLYLLIRMSVRTDQQIRRCLWIAVAAAGIVAVLAILQSVGLFGVARILTTYYAPYGDSGALSAARGSSTLGLPAATADVMIYSLAIVAGLWARYPRRRILLAPLGALFLLGALAAGEFSSAIGLLVGIVCIALVTNSARLLRLFLPACLVASQLLQPVFAARLSGFQTVNGLPVSWTGRLRSLETYFWPQLFNGWNFLLGVRTAGRIPLASRAAGFAWIESGYTWLLWAGGIPLLASFMLFVVTTAQRAWHVAHQRTGAISVAAMATFVAIIVTTVLMAFDPHVTYRGSADLLFTLIALSAPRRSRPAIPAVPINANHMERRS